MPAASSRALSLFAVDLGAATEIWRQRAHDEIVNVAPRGRLASLLSAGDEPHRRDVFDAIVEDLAEAALWDAPVQILADAFASLAKVSRRSELELDRLDAEAAPAYPAELLDLPFVERADSANGLVILCGDAALLEAGARAVRKALELPVGAFPTTEPQLWRDLLEALPAILAAAAQPGFALLAQRS